MNLLTNNDSQRKLIGGDPHILRNRLPEKYDIAQNTGTIPVVQKQPYDKYDIAQNTGTIPVEQKQHYDQPVEQKTTLRQI